MKKLFSIISAGLLLLSAVSCVQEDLTSFDPTQATAPVLGSYEIGEKAITATYTPGTFKMGFNEKMPVNHSLAIVSVDGNKVSKTLTSTAKDGTLSLTTVNLAKALIALGYPEGSTVNVELAVRASMQEVARDNGRNGHVDSEGRITINGFLVEIPEVVGSPYAEYTTNAQDTDDKWSITGALSNYGISWDKDLNMWTDGNGNFVAPAVKLAADDKFKFRKDQAWTVNMGGDFSGIDNEFSVSQDGPDIAVGAAGTYDIWFNSTAGTAWITEAYNPYPDYTEASNWGVTGALPKHGISWDGDIPMITDGSNHVALGVSLGVEDKFKFRQDAAWTVNLGGEFGGLDNDFAVTQDGPDISVGIEGEYDIFVNPGAGTAKVVAATGAKASSVIGGDEPVTPPVVVTGWNIIGLNGDWDNDVLASEKDGVWTAYITAEGDTEFKWRKDAGWDENYGGTLVELGQPFAAVAGGDNIKIGAGFYKVVLNTNDLTITVSNGDVWSLIGDFNSWGGDVDMELVDGKWVSPETAITAGGLKIRHNHDWAENVGGTLAELGQPFDAVAGGDNIAIPSDGTYIVTYDPSAQTITVVNAKKTWSVIGVNDDWNTDVAMTEVMPGIWVSDMITVEKGGWKVRFDKGWDVNRGGATPSKQGEFVKAVQGGDNVNLLGTFKVVYNANNETIGTLQWGVVGSIASIAGFSWNNDVPMNLGADGKWYSIPVYLTATDEIKVRENAGWDNNRGGDCAAVNEAFAVTNGGNNFKAPADGTYMVVYDPSAETITLSTQFWGVIGDFNSWGGDVFMMYDGAGKWAAYNQTITGGWKIRQGCGWDINRGGTYTAGAAFPAAAGGDNINVSDKETFSIIYDSVAETITIE